MEDIILLHDSHWAGKGTRLEQLIAKLQEKLTPKTMVPVPPGLKSVRYK